MEHHRSQREACTSDLTEMRFSQLLNFQPGVEVGLGLLVSQPNGSEVNEAPNGRKRKARTPTRTPEEKRMKKNEADRIYRKNRRNLFDKMMAIASRFGGVDNMEHRVNQIEAELQSPREDEQQMETEFRRLEQMKCKFGGIEEMESKLHAFHQIASILGGIDEILPQISRLKNIEFQYINSEQMKSHLNPNAQPFDFLQQQDYHGLRSVNFSNQVQGPMVDWLVDYETSEMFLADESGTVPDLVYSDELVTEFNAKLDGSVKNLHGFDDLHGECPIVGDYTYPWSFISDDNDNFDYHSGLQDTAFAWGT